jgi:hypothetical protein
MRKNGVTPRMEKFFADDGTPQTRVPATEAAE